MNLKEYFEIKEDAFIITSDYLFIHHDHGNELVLNLKTKERFVNKEIKNSLANEFRIPITKKYKHVIKYKDRKVYEEEFFLDIYEEEFFLDKPRYLNNIYLSYKDGSTDLDRLAKIWAYNDHTILKEYKNYSLEKLTDDLIPTGETMIDYSKYSYIYNRFEDLMEEPINMLGNPDYRIRMIPPPQIEPMQLNYTFTMDNWIE